MRLTNNHLVFIASHGRLTPIFAKRLTLEDKVISVEGEQIIVEQIASLDFLFLKGFAAPLTQEGTMLGDLKLSIFQHDQIWFGS